MRGGQDVAGLDFKLLMLVTLCNLSFSFVPTDRLSKRPALSVCKGHEHIRRCTCETIMPVSVNSSLLRVSLFSVTNSTKVSIHSVSRTDSKQSVTL